MKQRTTISILFILAGFVPVFAGDLNNKAMLREISNLEQAGDDLMELMMKVEDRAIRREITEYIDDIYEAAERMRKLVVDDSFPEPLRPEDLDKLLAALDDASFGDAKAAMVAEFARSNWFTIEQVGKILDEISFGDDMIEAAVAMYPHVVDPENAYLLYEHITFSDDREELKKRLDELEQGLTPE